MSFPLPGVTVHLTYLGCPPTLQWSLDLLWGQLRLWSGPTPACSCLQCPQLSELVHFLLWALNVLLYNPQTQSLLSWLCGFSPQLVQLVGRFWVLVLSHIAPGFQVWFCLHLCMWISHRGLLLRPPCRTWVCPSEGRVWRCCSCLGHRGLAAPGTQAPWRLGKQEMCSRRVWELALAFSPGEPLDREASQATVHRVTENLDMTEATLLV